VINLSPDALFAALIGVAIVTGLGLTLEPWLSPTLLRMRVARLPHELAERLGEEWMAELASLDTRATRLLFSASLFFMSTKRLLGDDVDSITSPLRGPQVILSHEVQVTADVWSRLPAFLIDGAMSLPLALVVPRWIPATSATSMLEQTAIGLAWMIVMHVILVQRYGGSPGKLLMKLRIVTPEGAPVGYQHALLRILPGLTLSVLSALVAAWAISQIASDLYGNMTGVARQRAMLATIPDWIEWTLSGARFIWSWGDLLVYLVSLDHRAWHDLIANTMVIYKVPKVVGTLDTTPRGSTSAMR
jgi:uncharacterized RDD family membrane protein YckC